MKKSWIMLMALGFMGVNVPAFAAPLLRPCLTASYLATPQPLADNREPAQPDFKQVPANTLGCKRGVSRRVDANTTIWRCQVELDDGVEFKEGQPEYGFLIQRRDRPLQELPDDLMAGAFENFDVINVDLDQRAGREHILAAWNGQSNGMGVHRWTIFVFDANWNLAERFDDVADWGRGNLVAAPRGRVGCDIALTSYEPVSSTSSSLMMRARFMRAAPPSSGARTPGAALVVASDRPSLERRYNRAFEATRTSWFSKGQWQWRGDIATWLNNAATRTRPYTP